MAERDNHSPSTSRPDLVEDPGAALAPHPLSRNGDASLRGLRRTGKPPVESLRRPTSSRPPSCAHYGTPFDGPQAAQLSPMTDLQRTDSVLAPFWEPPGRFPSLGAVQPTARATTRGHPRACSVKASQTPGPTHAPCAVWHRYGTSPFNPYSCRRSEEDSEF